MNTTDEFLLRLAIFILVSAGYFVARHIYNHKKADKPLVCPIRFDCNAVVSSDYSKFLGIPLEILGMYYYAVHALLYLMLIFWYQFVPLWFIGLLVLSSIVSFLFSVYLILVQLLILKKGCSWCFVSATICILVFILNILIYDLSVLFLNF